MSGDWPTLKPGDAPADITLLLEGTFPMVRGGVSSWVNQLIRGLPDRRFALIFVGGAEAHYKGIVYERPANVVHLEIHYLMDGHTRDSDKPKQFSGNRKAFAASDALHGYFKEPTGVDPTGQLKEVAKLLGERGALSHHDFLHSREAWDQIVEYYKRYCTDPSFVDYFWSVRNMHSPLFVLAQIARNMPATRCLHSISTGYAGFLGALAHHLHDVPFILTEHGIYTKERQIDLTEADWIKTYTDVLTHGFSNDVSYIRRLWIRFFDGIGRLTYSAANPITTLYEGNRERQILDGAISERTRVIPNGIPLDRYTPIRQSTFDNTAPIVTLIGRVTPIKEIKTFIRAMRIVVTRMPEARGWIVGPEDEDPDYAQECRDLVRQLSLEQSVEFLGFQQIADIMSQVRVVALTSISEAQPLVLLEAMASGLPVVCTDVGSCYELVYGKAKAGQGQKNEPIDPLEAAGQVVPMADPVAAADALVDLLTDRALWERCRAAGIQRVDSEYGESLMLERYAHLYTDAIARGPTWAKSSAATPRGR